MQKFLDAIICSRNFPAKKAHELEQSDGIKYMVTLDAQYQMQPTLGNFVSQNFCEPYSESFRSPRPAEDFPQAICPLSVQYREAEQHGAICRLVTVHGMLFINVFVNGKRPGFLKRFLRL